MQSLSELETLLTVSRSPPTWEKVIALEVLVELHKPSTLLLEHSQSDSMEAQEDTFTISEFITDNRSES